MLEDTINLIRCRSTMMISFYYNCRLRYDQIPNQREDTALVITYALDRLQLELRFNMMRYSVIHSLVKVDSFTCYNDLLLTITNSSLIECKGRMKGQS